MAGFLLGNSHGCCFNHQFLCHAHLFLRSMCYLLHQIPLNPNSSANTPHFVLLLSFPLYTKKKTYLLFKREDFQKQRLFGSSDSHCLSPPWDQGHVPAINMSPSPGGSWWHRVMHSSRLSLMLTRMHIACLRDLESQILLKIQSQPSFPLTLNEAEPFTFLGSPNCIKFHCCS